MLSQEQNKLTNCKKTQTLLCNRNVEIYENCYDYAHFIKCKSNDLTAKFMSGDDIYNLFTEENRNMLSHFRKEVDDDEIEIKKMRQNANEFKRTLLFKKLNLPHVPL